MVGTRSITSVFFHRKCCITSVVAKDVLFSFVKVHVPIVCNIVDKVVDTPSIIGALGWKMLLFPNDKVVDTPSITRGLVRKCFSLAKSRLRDSL